MDTNSSKMLSTTTPFSINDILTRNNTSIFRRIPDESAVDPKADQHSASAAAAAAVFAHAEFQKYRRFPQPRSSTPSDSRSEPDQSRHHSPIEFYYNNNNNNNESRSYQHHHHNHHQHNDHQQQSRVVYENVSKEKDQLMAPERHRYHHHHHHHDDEKLDYYSMGHQIGGETPLDMRRCTTATSNDSGEFFFLPRCPLCIAWCGVRHVSEQQNKIKHIS